ncbi:MAG: toxin-antitoxin system HicB family antitoxin [Gemmatimonadota bacterium]|nr:toxin-antitoxin system HicB family antitoxin [Gemmatimonadota bacterium]MDE2873416.1 toxin-antitoxin system HicB family antitoxin [Gemmatimonadota bacterium]
MTRDTTRVRRPPSGRFIVRVDPELHASLRDAARAAGTSLNRHCARKLAAPAPTLDEEAVAIVRRAGAILGDSFLGIVAFGSWTRGEESPSSDLDVLVVADDGFAITRGLYRKWDAEPPLSWHGHPVSPHFAHMRPGHDPVSGFWAEVALDGLIVFDPEWVVSRYLVTLRRRISDGEIERRVVGGRAYWVREGA